MWYTWLKSERGRENYAEQFVRMGVGLFDLRLCRLVLRGDVCRGERGPFCQPRLFGGAGLPHLRVRRVADRAVSVAGAGQPAAVVCGVGAVDQPDRICDRLCAGKNLPPKMVGLFGSAVPAGWLCLSAVFAAVGRRVRGGAAAGAPAGNEADPLGASVGRAHSAGGGAGCAGGGYGRHGGGAAQNQKASRSLGMSVSHSCAWNWRP